MYSSFSTYSYNSAGHSLSCIITDVRGVPIQVYELRDESWFDRGTGICRGMINADGHAVILVEAESPQVQENEDEPGGFLTKDILLNSNVERDDIYGKQQGLFPASTRSESDNLSGRYSDSLDGSRIET